MREFFSGRSISFTGFVGSTLWHTATPGVAEDYVIRVVRYRQILEEMKLPVTFT